MTFDNAEQLAQAAALNNGQTWDVLGATSREIWLDYARRGLTGTLGEDEGPLAAAVRKALTVPDTAKLKPVTKKK